MRLLLDTCAVIWWFLDDPDLRAPAAGLIEDGKTDITVSVVSLWEIAIKRRAGRLNLPVAVLEEIIRTAGWTLLALRPAHLRILEKPPSHHRDPFDHLLISQAIAEKLTLMTGDDHMARYDVPRIDC